MKYKAVSTLSLLISGLFTQPAWSQEAQTILDKNGIPIFEMRIFGTQDGPYGYDDYGNYASSSWNLNADEKSRVIASAQYWADLIQVVPGQNPAIINVGTYDAPGASAQSPLTDEDQAGAVTKVQAAITGLPPGPIELGAHGYIDVGKMDWSGGTYTPSQLPLTAKVDMTTVVVHEVAHALGISSNIQYFERFPNSPKPILEMPDELSVWESHLYDDNNQVAQPGQTIYCQACDNVTEDPDGNPIPSKDIFDVRNDKAYFSGTHVRDVLAGAMPGVPLTLYSYPPLLDTPVWSHLELKNSLMSHQNYRNYTNLMEAEVAVLQDLGYTIDRRNFWGYSVYGDSQTLTNDNPFFARNKEGTAYVPNTYNTSILGLGLHIYGSYNNITQRADLLAAGAGSGGIRVDGEGNHLTILPGTRVHANGSHGRGVMFAYGKDHSFTHRGDVEALGEQGIAASFDFGHNALGDDIEYRGSYIHTSNFSTPPLIDELRGPLVKTADITGRLAGTYASLYISDNAYVDTINIMGQAQLSGDILSQYNQVDDHQQQRLTTLTFGKKADTNGQATNQADANFAMAYQDNIVGINNLSLQLVGGTTQLTGNHAVYEAKVAQGATLSGSGNYQIHQNGAFINQGTVAPSTINSVIHIDGSYQQTNSGALQLAVNDQRQFNRLVVDGNADIKGALNVAVAPGYYANGFNVTSDKWVQAGALTGSFDSLSTTIASPTLSAAASSPSRNTYTVSVSRQKDAYSQYGTNANTRNVGQALNTVAQNAPASTQGLISALDFSNPDGSTVRQALPQLTGEAYASTSGALVNASSTTRSAVWGRLQQAFGGASVAPIVVASTEPVPTAMDANPRSAAWGYGFGTWSHQQGSHGAAKLKSTTGGFLTGVDASIDSDWRLGVLAGYSHSTFKVDDRASSGSSDNYTLGTYAGREWPTGSGALAFRSGASYTWHRLEMDRHVNIGGFKDKLSSNYHAGTFQLFGELGYKTNVSDRFTVEPYANLAYVNLNTDRFKEKGNNGAALSVRSDTMNTVFSTLGTRLSTQFDLGSIPTTARADIGWRHAFGDTKPTSTASLLGSNAFTVSGNPIGKNAALLETGLDFNVAKHTSLGVAYQGQFGSGLKQNAFNVNLQARF
jgi:subtilase-type serine protease